PVPYPVVSVPSHQPATSHSYTLSLHDALPIFSRETGVPLVATNDVHYVRAEDHAVQDVLLCIGTGKTLEDEDRMRVRTDQMYLKDRKSTRLNSSHVKISYAVFCLKKKKKQ